MKLADLDTFEPLLSDERVEQLAFKLKSAYGFKKLQDTEFITFIQPAFDTQTEVNGIQVPVRVAEMAVFGCLSPNPRRYPGISGNKILSHATSSLEDFREAEAEAAHYAGRKDPAMGIFRLVVQDHLRQLEDLRQLIN